MRDLILVERVTDGERCQYVGANPGHPTEGRKGCPFLIAYDEEVGEHYALHTYYFCMTFQERLLSSFTKTPCRLEITRCPACLATPSAVVVTPEMMRWIQRAHDACADPCRPRQSVGEMLAAWLDRFGNSVAFQHIDGVGR